MNTISIREFSRRMGCSDTAVHKAIKSGKIVKGLIHDQRGRPRIIFEVAQAEWQTTFSTSRVQNPKLAENVLGETASPVPQPAAEQAVQSKAKAQQVEAFFKAKLRQLEYEEKVNKLVDKDKVYQKLFAIGQELRKAIMAVPDRVIDNVLASQSRQQAHTLLYEELAKTLEHLTDTLNRPIYE